MNSDLELIQDSPEYVAKLLDRYRGDRFMLVGALILIARGTEGSPQDLAKKTLDQVLDEPLDVDEQIGEWVNE